MDHEVYKNDYSIYNYKKILDKDFFQTEYQLSILLYLSCVNTKNEKSSNKMGICFEDLIHIQDVKQNYLEDLFYNRQRYLNLF